MTELSKMETHIEKRILNFHLDSFGMVHHGKYLELFEEGRWDYCYRNGLVDEFFKRGICHVVVNVTIDYALPAVFGDVVSIRTEIRGVTDKSVIFGQAASRGGTLLVSADITNVFLHRVGGAPVKVEEMISFWEDLRRQQR